MYLYIYMKFVLQDTTQLMVLDFFFYFRLSSCIVEVRSVGSRRTATLSISFGPLMKWTSSPSVIILLNIFGENWFNLNV